MHIARTLLTLGLLTSNLCAQPVHKCVGPDGRISYSGHPCAVGAGARAKILTVGTGVRVQSYDVEAPDIPGLLRTLNARSTYHGEAKWNLSYRFRTQPIGKRCAVTSVATKLDLAMTLPRWRPPAGVSTDALARWERYIAALRVHEEGHLEHGRGAEREFRAAAQGVSALDCNAAGRLVREHFDRILADYQARDVEYDQRTGHGKTQGAWLQ